MDTIAVGLPGETEPVAVTTEPTPAKPKRRLSFDIIVVKAKWKTALYGSAALVGLGLMTYATIPSQQPVTQNSVTLPTPKPIPGASTVADQKAAEADKSGRKGSNTTFPKQSRPVDAMSELAALHEADMPEPAVEPAPVASPAPVQQAPAPAPVQDVVVKAPAPAPVDPVQTVSSLTPAPMTPQQQLDVLGLVREMGVVVRDQRQEIAALRKTVADLGGRIGEFDQRLSLAEARGAVAAAMGAPASAPERRAEQKVAEAAPVVHHFRVQAASPGLAMLSVTDPGPDGAGPVQVQVGEQVPGYGKVKSIAQQGTTWRVLTERGAIE